MLAEREVLPQPDAVRGVLVVSAVAVLVAACSASVPPLADSTLSTAAGSVEVQAVYVAPVSDDCAYAILSGVAAFQGGLVLSESTCSPEAGDDDASDAQFRLVRLTGDQVEELPLPPDVSARDGVRVLGASDDGVVYVSTVDVESLLTALWRRPVRGGWEQVTQPALPGDRHAGDGGPAEDAVVEDPLDVQVGDDGLVYVLEPHAVRRIGLDGVIETVAGSDRNDPADLSEFDEWGSGGGSSVRPDPRALPASPVPADEFPLPRLTAMDVADDGTLWLASHDAVLRVDTAGTLTLHVDAAGVVPQGQQSALVGARGSSSSIISIVASGSSLLLLDGWSGRVLRLDGQELRLVLGRPEEERASCPPPQLGEALPPTRVCTGELVERPDGSVLVTHDAGVLSVPRRVLTREQALS